MNRAEASAESGEVGSSTRLELPNKRKNQFCALTADPQCREFLQVVLHAHVFEWRVFKAAFYARQIKPRKSTARRNSKSGSVLTTVRSFQIVMTGARRKIFSTAMSCTGPREHPSANLSPPGLQAAAKTFSTGR